MIVTHTQENTRARPPRPWAPGFLPTRLIFLLVQLQRARCKHPVMSISPDQTLALRRALQHAVLACSERCLYQAARWYVNPLYLTVLIPFTHNYGNQ